MNRRTILNALALGGVFALSGAANALIFEFGTEFAGSPGNAIQPAGRLTVTQEDTDMVKCVLENLVPTGLGYTQFISAIALNVESFPASGRTGSFQGPVTNIAWSKDKNNSGRKFDVEVSLTSAAGSRLGPGMATTFYLQGLGLLESDFLSTSPGHADTFGSVHVQSTPNGESNKLLVQPVPEPASLLALSGGLLWLRRRAKRA